MNLDETIDPVAKEIVCGSVGYSTLVSPGLGIGGPTNANKLTSAEYDAYCGAGVSGTWQAAGTAVMNQATAVSNLATSIPDKIAKYTDPTEAYKLFTSGNQVGGSIMKEVTKYFKMICTTKCEMGQNMSNPR